MKVYIWYKVYIYSKSIPHKLEQNQAHKNTIYFYASARNRAPIFPDRAPIFYEWEVSILL